VAQCSPRWPKELRGGVSVLPRLPNHSFNFSMSNSSPEPLEWQEQIFSLLKEAKVRQVAYVPDSGHSHVIKRVQADPEIRDVVLTTEEEGVAAVSGAWLGGERAVLLMQCSGVGNCVNMFSLLESCRFPFFTIITMRGEYAEFNPWQCPMGLATARALELMGVIVYRANAPEDVADLVDAGLHSAFEAGQRVAILLSQSLIGRKKWER
jgi:sulfopyruvate decarboxylase alpha subunit